ncbi:CPBP family intramembrane glutamic endopeptidase [Chromobacterium alticapitis]|uniref:CPBP family intramembrane metalloprotease domain-containing protein n=1 Tax=Chromobacterium alticapitis TaxID=2073169 RepID=A0A2S5DJ41_9NEIS|nr:CPBP family intramembrane glutamic endopeptidase [Chromobacterium alticapitis]POZ63012.1 CPBP family intramembrane metalloprotease domain-containing protein [Chromobacterium alticapitis]
MFLPSSLSLAAFALLAIGLISASLRLAAPGWIALACSAMVALAAGLLQPLGLVFAAAGVGLTLALLRRPRPELALVWIALLLALAVHALPGFDNPLLWQGKASPDSAPYRLFWSYDKGLAGLLLLLGLARAPLPERRLGWPAAAVGALALLFVLGIAAATGVIGFAPKWPAWLLPWLLANCFLVSLVEEAFFRAGVQRWLELRTEPFAALMAASLLFGLVHLAGGWAWMALATLAGIGYGLIYAARRQLWLAALAHLGFNTLHLLLFTYPKLA